MAFFEDTDSSVSFVLNGLIKPTPPRSGLGRFWTHPLRHVQSALWIAWRGRFLLLVAQGVDGVEARCFVRWEDAEEHADADGEC